MIKTIFWQILVIFSPSESRSLKVSKNIVAGSANQTKPTSPVVTLTYSAKVVVVALQPKRPLKTLASFQAIGRAYWLP